MLPDIWHDLSFLSYLWLEIELLHALLPVAKEVGGRCWGVDSGP